MESVNQGFMDDVLLNAPVHKWTAARACAAVANAFGLQVSATLLTSERDQNFRVTTADGRDFVLKVTNPAEDPVITLYQTQVQEHLMHAENGVPVPHLIRALDGAFVHWYVGEDGVRQALRLITFLPGVPLYQVERGLALRAAVGHALALFDMALADSAIVAPPQMLLWDTQHADRLDGLLPLIEDSSRRALAEKQMDIFKSTLRPALLPLRRQIIHNDMNAYNIMVDAGCHSEVTAILDFGDIAEAPLVLDVAVASAYQLSDSTLPISSAAELIAGYHRVNPLTDEELTLIPDLIATRLMVTTAITGWRATLHPENRDYILRNNAISWIGLSNMLAMSRDEAMSTLYRAIEKHQEP